MKEFEIVLHQILFLFGCIVLPVILLWLFVEWNEGKMKAMNKGLGTAEIFRKAGVRHD